MKFAGVAGILGIVLIQLSSIPTIAGVILGLTTQKPPANMVLIAWFGLVLFLYNALAKKDKLYIASNTIGLLIQSALLAVVLL